MDITESKKQALGKISLEKIDIILKKNRKQNKG